MKTKKNKPRKAAIDFLNDNNVINEFRLGRVNMIELLSAMNQYALYYAETYKCREDEITHPERKKK